MMLNILCVFFNKSLNITVDSATFHIALFVFPSSFNVVEKAMEAPVMLWAVYFRKNKPLSVTPLDIKMIYG